VVNTFQKASDSYLPLREKARFGNIELSVNDPFSSPTFNVRQFEGKVDIAFRRQLIYINATKCRYDKKQFITGTLAIVFSGHLSKS